MATVKQRPGSRRDRGRATRLRITKAAYTLFCERGYVGTTMADIAAAAGVAVQTVYFTFHTKSELLSRAYDFAVLGEGDPLPPERQPWYAKLTAEPNVLAAIRNAVEGIGEILKRATPLDTVVRAGAGSDPDTAAVRVRHTVSCRRAGTIGCNDASVASEASRLSRCRSARRSDAV